MDDKDFFSFVCDQYKSAFDLSNALYPRCGIILTAQVVLGSAILGLGRHDLIGRTFQRVDVFAYYLSAAAAFTCLSAAVFQLILAIFPRDYPKVASLAAWRQWRDDYLAVLKRAQPDGDKQNAEQHESACLRALLDRLIDATDKANAINQLRLLCLQKSIRLTAIGVAAIGIEALTAFILKVQGI